MAKVYSVKTERKKIMLKFINIQINKEEKSIILQVDPETLPEMITDYFKALDKSYTGKFYIDVLYTIRHDNTTGKFDFFCKINDHSDFITVPRKNQLVYESSFSQGGVSLFCPCVISERDTENIKNKCKNLLSNLYFQQNKNNDGVKIDKITLYDQRKMIYCQIAVQTLPVYIISNYANKYPATYTGQFGVWVKFDTASRLLYIVSDMMDRDRKLMYDNKTYCDYILSESDINNILTACRQKLIETGCIKLWMSQCEGVDSDITSELREVLYAKRCELNKENNHIVDEHSINAERAEYLHNNTPGGMIKDADTILEDIIENRDKEVSGVANDVFEIYKNTSDKKAVKAIFEAITGTTFDDYVDECVKNTTRKQE